MASFGRSLLSTPAIGRRGLLATTGIAAMAAPAFAQGSKRRVQVARALDAAIQVIRDGYVDPVALRPLLESSLDGIARFAPPAATTGASALQEARRGIAAAAGDTEAVAALVAGIRRLAGAAEVDALDPVLTAALRGMATGLDPRSDYLPADAPGVAPPAPAIGGIGLEVAITRGQVTVIRPLPGGPAEGRIRTGDILLALDGRPLDGLPLAEAVDLMRGPIGTELAVTLRRAGESLTLRIPRRPVGQPGLRSALLGRVAYVRPEAFRAGTMAEFRAAFGALATQAGGRLEGLVLDLRENSGGLLDAAAAIAGGLLRAGETVATLRGRSAGDNRTIQATGDLAPDLPAAVAVNDGTAAGAEIVAGALRDHRRAPMVGRTTVGAGTIDTIFPLAPTGGMLRIITARVTLPSGRGFDGAGLAPDLLVEAEKGSVAARLHAARAGQERPRRAPEPAPAWPALAPALARSAAQPAERPAAGGPESDPEIRRAEALVQALRNG